MAVPPCPPAASTCRQMGRGHGAVPGGDTFTPPPSRGGCEGPAKLMTPLASGGATGATLISANGFPCLLNSSLFPAGAHACRSHEPHPPPLPIPPPLSPLPPAATPAPCCGVLGTEKTGIEVPSLPEILVLVLSRLSGFTIVTLAQYRRDPDLLRVLPFKSRRARVKKKNEERLEWVTDYSRKCLACCQRFFCLASVSHPGSSLSFFCSPILLKYKVIYV